MKKTTIKMLALCVLFTLVPLGASAATTTYSGNELADIFVVDNSGTAKWYESNDGFTNLVYQQDISVSVAPLNAVAVGQIAGDGSTWTLAFGTNKSPAQTGPIRAYKNDGTTMFSYFSACWTSYVSASATTVAANSMSMYTPQSGTGAMSFTYNVNTKGYIVDATATGGFGESAAAYNSAGISSATATLLTDFTNNGTASFFVSRPSVDYVAWYTYDLGTKAFTWQSNINGSSTFNVIDMAAGDITGDGKTDLFSLRDDGKIIWDTYSGSGTSRITFTMDALDANSTSIALGDINNDGTVEFVLGTTSGLNVYTFDSTAHTFTSLYNVAVTNGVKDFAISAVNIPEPFTVSIVAMAAMVGLVKRRKN